MSSLTLSLAVLGGTVELNTVYALATLFTFFYFYLWISYAFVPSVITLLFAFYIIYTPCKLLLI